MSNYPWQIQARTAIDAARRAKEARGESVRTMLDRSHASRQATLAKLREPAKPVEVDTTAFTEACYRLGLMIGTR